MLARRACVVNDRPAMFPDACYADSEAEAILMRCLQRPREERFDSMTELATSLRAVV